MKLKCIIIDDIAIARRGLEDYIHKIPSLELIGSFYNAFEALESINSQMIDLIFLDVNMPLLSGIDFIKKYNPKQLIIFTTAYSDFAILGYELNVVDYLLKPISYDRFCNAVEKAIKQFNNKVNDNLNYIYLKTSTKVEKVLISDILYVESLANYVKLHLLNKEILYYTSLNAIQSQLEKFNFIRVHRSYLVNINKIDLFEKSEIRIGNNLIPIGPNFKSNFIDSLSKIIHLNE